jgi:catechol 2,3-dioxygenase-like lactoylglutathione lyase family enzyme
MSFYRDILGIPLKDEEHGDTHSHYGCEVGDIHFAIHPAGDDDKLCTGSVKIAFEVFDMEEHLKSLKKHDIQLLYPIQDMGFMKLAAISDPDGNTVEFTELSADWFQYLKDRRNEGHDMVSAWERRKGLDTKGR